MSEIQKALAAATEVEPSKRKNETITDQSYLERLALAVADITDEEWEKLPTAAQDWYNEAADAIEKKRDIDPFPDLPKAEEKPAARRRGATAAEPEKYEPKKGDVVTVVTSRDKEYTGEIVELDKEGLVLDVDGKDVELDHAKIKSIVLSGEAAGKEPEPETPKDPEVGDTVKVVTKRGKEIVGNIKELTDDDMVVEDATGEIHELSKDRLTSVEIKYRPKAARAGGEGSTTKEKPTAKAAEKKEKADKPVTSTQRLRDLIVSDLAMTKDAISKTLTKEGFGFKQATVDLIYSDSHKLIGLLKEAGHIKA